MKGLITTFDYNDFVKITSKEKNVNDIYSAVVE